MEKKDKKIIEIRMKNSDIDRLDAEIYNLKLVLNSYRATFNLMAEHIRSLHQRIQKVENHIIKKGETELEIYDGFIKRIENVEKNNRF